MRSRQENRQYYQKTIPIMSNYWYWNMKSWKNNRYHSIMMSIGESSSSSILSTKTSLNNYCCCLQSGHNNFLLGLFFNFKQSKWNFPYLHCLLKHWNSSPDLLPPQQQTISLIALSGILICFSQEKNFPTSSGIKDILKKWLHLDTISDHKFSSG